MTRCLPHFLRLMDGSSDILCFIVQLYSPFDFLYHVIPQMFQLSICLSVCE